MIKPEDVLKALESKDEQIKKLERQIEILKNYIKDKLGEDTSFTDLGLYEVEEDLIDGIPLTKREMERLEHSSIILEQHANMFNYGRSVREEKMAESL